MKLSIFEAYGVGKLHGEDVEFNAISTDTRSLKAGELFVALRGERFDAHDQLDDAAQAGAVGVVIDKKLESPLPSLEVADTTLALGQIGKYYRERFDGTVIALTGSSGKTSVKGMLKAIFDVKHLCSATEGNFNNHIGVPLTLVKLNSRSEFAIVEAGTNSKGEIAYLTGLIQPNISLVINIQAAHLEGFGGLASIAKEKSAIYLSPSVHTAVVNLDDNNSDILYAAAQAPTASGDKKRRIVGFSVGKATSTSYQVDDLVSASGTVFDKVGRARFNVQINNNAVSVALRVLGEHAVENALAAAATAFAAGISMAQIKEGLESFTGVGGRMEVLDGLHQCTLIDDSYNANPGSMMAAIDFLSRHHDSFLLCGDMAELGEDAEQLHSEVGQYAMRNKIGHVFSVGEYSHGLSVECGDKGKHFSSKEKMLEECKALINKDSMVLVKGSRSAQMDTVVDGLKADGVN